MTLYYEDLPATNAPDNPDPERCRVTIGKETTTFLLAREKALRSCWDARLSGQNAQACPDATAREGTPARDAAEKIARAGSASARRICKACGGPSKTCDADINTALVVAKGATIPGNPAANDDLLPAVIGFGSTCPALTLSTAPGTRCELLNGLDGNPLAMS
jgi:hypothetical protein